MTLFLVKGKEDKVFTNEENAYGFALELEILTFKTFWKNFKIFRNERSKLRKNIEYYENIFEKIILEKNQIDNKNKFQCIKTLYKVICHEIGEKSFNKLIPNSCEFVVVKEVFNFE
jgi:hypothetical protein